jgi:hypothetical protein
VVAEVPVVVVLVTVEVPAGIVPLVPVALVSETTGVPPPVSVAVVAVVDDCVLWIVSVDPAVDSAGSLRPHAIQMSTTVKVSNRFMPVWCAM